MPMLVTGCMMRWSARRPAEYYEGEDAAAFRRIVAGSGWMVYGGNCYAFVQVASGFVDLALEAKVAVHDYCALVPIVENAGGIMTGWQGEPLTLRPAPGGTYPRERRPVAARGRNGLPGRLRLSIRHVRAPHARQAGSSNVEARWWSSLEVARGPRAATPRSASSRGPDSPGPVHVVEGWDACRQAPLSRRERGLTSPRRGMCLLDPLVESGHGAGKAVG